MEQGRSTHKLDSLPPIGSRPPWAIEQQRQAETQVTVSPISKRRKSPSAQPVLQHLHHRKANASNISPIIDTSPSSPVRGSRPGTPNAIGSGASTPVNALNSSLSPRSPRTPRSWSPATPSPTAPLLGSPTRHPNHVHNPVRNWLFVVFVFGIVSFTYTIFRFGGEAFGSFRDRIRFWKGNDGDRPGAMSQDQDMGAKVEQLMDEVNYLRAKLASVQEKPIGVGSLNASASCCDEPNTDFLPRMCPSLSTSESKRGYGYLGCYIDDDANRDLRRFLPTLFAFPEYCQSRCFLAGYPLAGLQNSGECWCGGDRNLAVGMVENASTIVEALGGGKYGKVGDEQCNLKCRGDPYATCGGRKRNSIYLSGLIDPRGGSMIQIPQKNQGSLIDSSAWCDGAPKQRTCRFKYLYLRIDSRNLKNSVSKKDNITFYFLRGEGSTIHNFDLLASEEAGTTLRAVLPLSTELSGKWVDIIIVEDPQQVRGQSAKGAWEPDGVVREPTLLFEPRRSTYEFTTDDLVPAFQALVSYSRPTPDRIPRSSGDAFVKNSILRHSVYQQMNQISEQLLLENQKSGLVEPERCATSSSLLGRALSFGRLCNPIPFDRYTRILIVGDGVQNDAAHLLRYLSYYPVTHIDDVSWEGIGTVPIDRIIPFSPSPEQPSPRSSAHEKNIFAVRFEDIRIGLNYLLPWSYAGDPIAGADLKVTKFGYLNLPHFADFLARAFGCDRRVTLSAQSLIQESLANSFGIVERSDRAFASGLLGLQPLDECETITDRPFMIIFVSRSRRKILNAPELARALKTLNLPLGVKLIPLVVQYEQWPASTLIRLVRCSGGIIAMHSSILSLSVFLPRNAFVIELFPFAIASESLRKYKDISSSMRGISYVSWENKAQANTRIFPDKTQKDGGIKHLNEELQSTIVAMRSSDAPPCCSHPFWTFRLNQDTVVDIDEISLLLKKFKPSKPS